MEHLKTNEIGNQGEHEIAKLLHSYGITQIRKPDFCIFHQNMWIAIEVKNKEPWQPPPKFMQGIPKTQYQNDLNMTHLGMPCLLIVRGSHNDWIGQWIIRLTPEPDPRKKIIAHDEIVWFGLDQFQPFHDFFGNGKGCVAWRLKK